jgi:protein DPCD
MSAPASSSSNSNLPTLPNGRRIKQATISQGKKILCFELPPQYNEELHEEYDVITDELLLRKYRKKSTIGNYTPWEIEVGLPNTGSNFVAEKDLMKESSAMPVITRKDTKEAIQFRIRNLNYPADVFSVSVDGTDPMTFVIRTSNKKYFKKLQIPELLRAKLPLEQASLSFEHERGTLIISYKKPLFLLAQENEDRKMRSSMKFQRLDDPKSAEAAQGCAQQ